MKSTIDEVYADTLGVAWRAASGTVDPWTKQQLIDNATADYTKAGMDPAAAAQQADQDTTTTLETFTYEGTTGADPSQFTAGVNNSLNQLGQKVKEVTTVGSKAVLFVGIGLALLFVVYVAAQSEVARKAV